MDSNLKLIFEEFEKLKGQFVITQSWEIERLIAIAEDDQDYYYVTYNGKKLCFNTCVGRLIPLKGFLRDSDYDQFIRTAKLNHLDQINCFGGRESKENKREILEYINQHKKEITTINLPDKFLTEICWDLN
jgi:hypothetical protein